ISLYGTICYASVERTGFRRALACKAKPGCSRYYEPLVLSGKLYLQLALLPKEISASTSAVSLPHSGPERNTPGVRLKDQGNPATRTVPQWGVGTSAMSWLLRTCGCSAISS